MPYCKACGYEVGPPEEDLNDPENLMQIVEGGVKNEDAHLQVKDGPKGPRIFCSEKGQVTKIVDRPPQEEGEGAPSEGEGGEPKPKSRQEIYDLPEEKDSIDILIDVVQKPMYGLNDAQVEELVDWAKDYDGQLPPDTLEDILKNFSGVQKQTAQLARQKYEVKLNKMMREKAEDSGGPPIGVSRRPSVGGGGGGIPQQRGGQVQRQPQQQPVQEHEQDLQDDGELDGSISSPSDLRTKRRERRVDRRQEAADIMVEKVAQRAADDIAREVTGSLSTYFGLPAKIIEAKIEKDPDWALEKLDEWGLDISDVMEPSSEKKKQMSNESRDTVNGNIDNALEDIKRGGEVKETPSETVNSDNVETNKTPNSEELDGNPFDDEPPDEEPERDYEEEVFDEHFG